MSRGFININHIKRQAISFFLYFKLLYRYIKEFDKDRNFIYKELFIFKNNIIAFKKYKILANYSEKLKLFLYEIKNDQKSSQLLKDFVHKLLYRYIKEFDKDRNFIYKELFIFKNNILYFP